VKAEDVLKQVAEEVSVCTKCVLHHSRKLAVPGEDQPMQKSCSLARTRLSRKSKAAFVGAAGKFLEELLGKVGLQRDQVFITNVVKCRPPGNRDPQPEEVETCTKAYLDRQIQVINPKVIVTLGRYSMGLFIPNVKISNVHGQAMQVRGRLVVPMYHPAAALHQGSLKPVVESDFARLPELIARAVDTPEVEEPETENKPEPKQLSLF
jgi:DNA polymerase